MADDKTPSAGSLKTRRGNCHCGAFVFEVDLPEEPAVVECNCSICYKKGQITCFPGTANFRFVKGDETHLTEYNANMAKGAASKFCPTCSTKISSKTDSNPEPYKLGINMRALQDFDTLTVKPILCDGASLPPHYVHADFTGPDPKHEGEGVKKYTGACHCKAVTVAVHSMPLDASYPSLVSDCNCSYCVRVSFRHLDLKKPQLSVDGDESLTKYLSGKEYVANYFCKTCGTTVYKQLEGITDEKLAAEENPMLVGIMKSKAGGVMLNMRVLSDEKTKEIKVKMFDGKHIMSPPYVDP